MSSSFADWLISKVGLWLTKNEPPRRSFLCDFEQICREIKPGDVILIEGRNRAARIIQQVTVSPWSHAALYIGHLNDVQDAATHEKLLHYAAFTVASPMIIESEVGVGTIVSPLGKYREDHIRILRPQGLTADDAQKVITFAVGCLGRKYNVRHLLDLLRFLFPWGLFPRRWRSSLFGSNALQPTEDICSSVIADVFHSIRFPILPLVRQDNEDNLELIQRNPRLFTPSDFDYSPYFNVIKYPIFKLGKDVPLDTLPWRDGVISDDIGLEMLPIDQKKKK
jgi:hypothetical protein